MTSLFVNYPDFFLVEQHQRHWVLLYQLIPFDRLLFASHSEVHHLISVSVNVHNLMTSLALSQPHTVLVFLFILTTFLRLV